MDNKDETMKTVNQRLLEAKSKLTLNKIVTQVHEKDGKTISTEWALEKFENYVNRFDLNLSEIESDYLKQMRVRMYDNNGLAPKHLVNKDDIIEPSVIVVDFKSRKVIKPH